MSGTADLPPEFVATLERLRNAAQALGTRSTATAQKAEEHAAAARRGDLGHAWQVVQQRIDLGQTTLSAVFDGSDTTPAARELRTLAQRNLGSLRATLQEQDEAAEPGDVPSPVAQARALLSETQEHLQAVTEEIRRSLRR